MAITVNPCLNFAGNTRGAMTYKVRHRWMVNISAAQGDSANAPGGGRPRPRRPARAAHGSPSIANQGRLTMTRSTAGRSSLGMVGAAGLTAAGCTSTTQVPPTSAGPSPCRPRPPRRAPRRRSTLDPGGR